MECVWVGAGGLVGSILRYAIHTLVQRQAGPAWTVAVKVSNSRIQSYRLQRTAYVMKQDGVQKR